MLNAQGVQPQALEVKDFSGGMTDKYIGADSKYFQKGDNFTISDDAKLVTRPGLTIADLVNPRIPTNTRINRFFDTIDQLFEVSNSKVYYNAGSGYNLLAGPSGNNVFGSGSTYTSFISTAFWNKHAFVTNSDYANPMKIFNDGTTWKAHQIGMPALASTPTITGASTGYTCRYAFHYYYQYTSQGILFEEVGPVLTSNTVNNSADPATANIAISNIPALTNSSSTNYDTANLKIKIFRTINAGSTYYKVGEVANGTLTFTDNVSDSIAQTNTTVYITGNQPDHGKAPKAKFCHSVNDILWLGNIQDDAGVIYPNKLRFSNRFSLWSFPGAYEENFDEEIKGINSINIYPIVFCQNRVYRIEGYYNPDGTGTVQKKLISSTAGCLSNSSIVRTDQGLFWAGNNGYYFTDGSTVTRISEGFNDTYAAITKTANQKNRITGAYDPVRQTVLWTMQNDSTSADCDSIYVAHLKFGITAYTPFTTWSGSTNFAPTCIHQYQGVIYHADTRGYKLKYDASSLTDPKISTTLSVSSWDTATIIYLYLGPAFDFGSNALRKWIPGLAVYADNVSSVSMLISSNNDNSGVFQNLIEVHYKGNIEWGDYDIVWGDVTVRWDYFPVIAAKRRFPAGGLRASYKQIRMTNAFTEIATSNDLGTATFNAVTGVVTLDNPSLNWPSDLLSYYITQDSDGYNKNIPILARTNTTITIDAATSPPVAGSTKWKIRGYRKREILKLMSYVIDYSYTSPTQDSYKGVPR